MNLIEIDMDGSDRNALIPCPHCTWALCNIGPWNGDNSYGWSSYDTVHTCPECGVDTKVNRGSYGG